MLSKLLLAFNYNTFSILNSLPSQKRDTVLPLHKATQYQAISVLSCVCNMLKNEFPSDFKDHHLFLIGSDYFLMQEVDGTQFNLKYLGKLSAPLWDLKILRHDKKLSFCIVLLHFDMCLCYILVIKMLRVLFSVSFML